MSNIACVVGNSWKWANWKWDHCSQYNPNCYYCAVVKLNWLS